MDNPFYKIDKTTGEIRTKLGSRLDYEEKDAQKVNQMRSIRVIATSQDGVFKYVTFVTVTIIDINDNQPIFDDYLLVNSSSHFSIVENTTNVLEPKLIARLKASDLDSGLNGVVNYKFDESSRNYAELDTLFYLEKESGKIWLRESMGDQIDRETNETIAMSVIAYDLGQPESLSSSLDITLKVLDINDNFPLIKHLEEKMNLEFSIEENSITFNYTFDAFDLDFGANASVFFYLEISNKSDTENIIKKFRVEPLSGELVLNSPLDYEERTLYEFDVVCSDSGEPKKLTSTVRVRVNVVDVNDNAPEFSTTFVRDQNRVYLNEALLRKDFSIQKFKAIDLDPTERFHNTSYIIKHIFKISSQFNREFILVDSNIKNAFLLSSKTGELRYESDFKLEDSSVTNEYLIQVEAYDEDKPVEFRNSMNFTIILLPSNNKLPVFLHKMKRDAE